MQPDAEDIEIDFGDDGLVPAIAQDVETGDVVMLAYVSPEALAATQNTGLAHYYSRSRDELWQKGEVSGHVQRVSEICVDCDGDALLYRVEHEGGACHTGFRSCFYRTIEGETVGEKVFRPYHRHLMRRGSSKIPPSIETANDITSSGNNWVGD